MSQPWLVGVKRRTLEDIKEFLRPSQIYRLITVETWPYKTQMEFYQARDRALMSLLYLTCGRITEVLSLKKSQYSLFFQIT
jgi:site-specific recombinase XerD